MTIGFNEWRLSDDRSCDERHRDCLLPEVSSQRTPGPCWEQLSADLIEISQRKHGLRPCQVLGQAAVSHFGEAPQLLDYAKGVFAARPGPRARPVDHPPALAQGPTSLRSGEVGVPQFRDDVKALTGGRGVEVVFDTVGGDVSQES